MAGFTKRPISGGLLQLGNFKGALLSGADASIKSINLGTFTKQVARFAHARSLDKRFIAYMTDDRGGGMRLSLGMAKSASLWVQEALLNTKGVRLKRIPESADYNNSPKYKEWKEAYFPGNPYGVLTETMANSFKPIASKAGGVILGIDQNKSVMQPISGSGWDSKNKLKKGPLKYKRVLVTNYAAALELKNNRALIAPAIQTWIGKYIPRWSQAFKAMWAKDGSYNQADTQHVLGTAGDISADDTNLAAGSSANDPSLLYESAQEVAILADKRAKIIEKHSFDLEGTSKLLKEVTAGMSDSGIKKMLKNFVGGLIDKGVPAADAKVILETIKSNDFGDNDK